MVPDLHVFPILGSKLMQFHSGFCPVDKQFSRQRKPFIAAGSSSGFLPGETCPGLIYSIASLHFLVVQRKEL